MAGQYWSPGEDGGYLYNDELSDYLRFSLQPLTKFRQFCDAEDGAEKGLHRGDTHNWNVYKKVKRQGRRLAEDEPIPETSFEIDQRSLTIFEAGQSVPYTGKLDLLAKHDLEAIIQQTLQHDARNFFDVEAFNAFDDTPLRATPSSGTSLTALTLDTDGTASVSNNVELQKEHIGLLADLMMTRNIPPFYGDDYVMISDPQTFRMVKNDLEALHIYTSEGMRHVFEGEIGRYDAMRFVRQTHIPRGGALDSATFDPLNGVADEWNNTKSSWAFVFGADTVKEAVVVPEEIRARIPGDYGRAKGIAWYYLGGFGIVHDDPDNARIIKWDSAT